MNDGRPGPQKIKLFVFLRLLGWFLGGPGWLLELCLAPEPETLGDPKKP